jgi:hypothetical protein
MERSSPCHNTRRDITFGTLNEGVEAIGEQQAVKNRNTNDVNGDPMLLTSINFNCKLI